MKLRQNREETVSSYSKKNTEEETRKKKLLEL